jgi:hypothetical protein
MFATVLTESDVLTCSIGGSITVTERGQTTVTGSQVKGALFVAPDPLTTC